MTHTGQDNALLEIFQQANKKVKIKLPVLMRHTIQLLTSFKIINGISELIFFAKIP